jgi:hypothetical protein
MKVEADAQMLGQPVSAEECADRITTGNQQDGPVVPQRVSQEVLLGPEILNAGRGKPMGNRSVPNSAPSLLEGA